MFNNNLIQFKKNKTRNQNRYVQIGTSEFLFDVSGSKGVLEPLLNFKIYIKIVQ